MNRIEKVISGASAFVRRCESAFVGLERVSAHTVVSTSGWVADDVGSYCGQCGSSMFDQGHSCQRSVGANLIAHGTVVRLSRYESPMSEWIRAMKYGSWHSMAEVLGSRLGRSILDSRVFADIEAPLLVPVPMPLGRRFARGMDHAHIVCRSVSKETGFKVVQPLRQRRGDVQSGATLSKRSRKRDPFALSLPGWLCMRRLEGREVIVIDDVRTTGRTLGLVSRALRRCGACVVGVGVLAVADHSRSIEACRRGS